jgi:DNA-binding transcriptional LysR family regulator
VLEGALDVALVRDPLDHPDLDIVPLASEERALMVGASHALATETVVSANDVLKEHTLPLGSPDPWSAFWQLDDLRGGPNRYADTAPATTISSMQLAVANADMIITVPAVMSRFAPNTLVHYVGLRDAEPSTIAVARRRNDRRTEVAAFVDQAISTTAAQIDVLPGGTLLQ